MTGALHVEVPRLHAGRLGGAVGQPGQRGAAAPQGEGVVEHGGRLGGVAVGQGAQALAYQPLETVQVDVVGRGGEPVAAVGGGDRVRAQHAAQPAHQGLHRAGGVGGRVAVPDLLHQQADRHAAVSPQGEHGQQGAQPCAPPTGTTVPSGRTAWVVPRMR